MHIVTYIVSPETIEAEKQFLKDNGVFPAEEKTYTWDRIRNTGHWNYRLGAIVDDQMLLSLTLRVKIEIKKPYVQGAKHFR